MVLTLQTALVLTTYTSQCRVSRCLLLMSPIRFLNNGSGPSEFATFAFPFKGSTRICGVTPKHVVTLKPWGPSTATSRTSWNTWRQRSSPQRVSWETLTRCRSSWWTATLCDAIWRRVRWPATSSASTTARTAVDLWTSSRWRWLSSASLGSWSSDPTSSAPPWPATPIWTPSRTCGAASGSSSA